MSNVGGEGLQQAPDQQSSVGDIDYQAPTVAERLLDSDMFQRSLDSRFIPLKVAAIGCVTMYAFSQGILHPEYWDQL
jgi:hypothetical protein